MGHEFYSQPSNSLPARSDQLDGKALALMVNSTVVLMMPILYKLLTCYSDTYPQIFVPYLCKSNSCGHIFTKIEPCPQGAKRRDCVTASKALQPPDCCRKGADMRIAILILLEYFKVEYYQHVAMSCLVSLVSFTNPLALALALIK